ncbi:DUF6049 family protein [Streptomyces sp. NPDC020489]|uniref:DUF6049 family protein n=1 Tax=Streptomyces sp. NPDC020489 TaxID=3365077 RepID=UPI0037B7CA1A
MAEAADFQGTSPSPARRWLRRTGALLAGTPLLAGLLQLPAAPAEAASGTGTVAVSLDSLTPSVPTDGDTLTVSGTVTNQGKQAVTDAQVDLRVGPEVNTRSAIDTISGRTDFQPGLDGDIVGGKYAEKFAKLTPGVAQNFSISVPVDELDLGSDGVYQLGVSLTGETAAQQWQQVLGIQRTFLPWQPEDADSKTKTTVLWPLVSTAHMTAETGSNEQQTPVFLDDDLAKEIAPGGRLEQMLSLGKQLDVTWVIDPDLLASVDAMTRAYRVESGGGTVAGTHQRVAMDWLAELQEAVADKEIVALPFSDPDLASLAHNGTSVTGSLNHLKEATDAAITTVRTVLHVTPNTDFAWPVEGAVDPSIVKVATSAGADKVIARSDSLQELGGLTYTPSAARPIGGGTTAVVADARLSTAFQGDLTKASTATLAVQKFLASSLALNVQTDKQRSIVVAPQRMPTASQARAMADAVSALQDGDWSRSQDLTAAAAAKPDTSATTRVPAASAYPSVLRKRELSKAAFEEIATTQAELNKFKVILSDQSRVVTPFGRAMNREMSTSWRGRAAEAQRYRTSVKVYLDSLTDQVKLIDKSETKLSGRSATIPVTVQNNLVQGVEHLVLRLTSTSPNRLKIGDGDYQEQQVEVSGGHSQSVKFTTSAQANGRATVTAQLYTEDGQAYGDPVQFDVRVTEFTATVMLVIGGGFLLLVLAGFRMYTQRKRAAAREAEEGGPDEADEVADATENPEAPEDRPAEESGTRLDADDPQQPSDPAPDTAAESADPSGTGERVDR